VAKLARFYSVMGHRPEEPGALALMAEILCQCASDEQIGQAMTRCARECRYPVSLSDLLQRIPGQEVAESEAEARQAWDVLTAFVRKFVGNDVYGNYGPEHGWYSNPPKLSDRILDTVRRSGGWKVYACMTDEDFPFVQKRFFEEYQAWTAIERINPSKLLTEMPRLQLVAKPMDIRERESRPTPRAQKVEIKRVQEAPTAEQMRDRAAVQKQGLEEWTGRRQRSKNRFDGKPVVDSAATCG
jgi:hypothetical protein